MKPSFSPSRTRPHRTQSVTVRVPGSTSNCGAGFDTLGLALDAVPARLRHEDVAAYLTTLPGVTEVHDLHIWGLSTTETALTAHLVHDGTKAEDHIRTLPEALRRRFGIGHVTVQWETAADAVLCHLRPDHVV